MNGATKTQIPLPEQEILPSGKADCLLTAMLQISRGWTSYPWYNNNGVEGRSHTRTCVFRLCSEDPTTGAVEALIYNDNSLSHLGHVLPSASVARANEDLTFERHGDLNGTAFHPISKERTETPSLLHHDPDSDDDYVHEDHGAATIRDVRFAVVNTVPAASKNSQDTMDPAGGKTRPSCYRPETYEEFALALDDKPHLAPPELLEVVPYVVNIVRR